MALTKITGKQVLVKQAGTGAVNRTSQDKLREFVSVKDFGAVGDGVTDDTAAIQAAIAYSLTSPFKALYVPAGSYYCPAGLVVSGDSADRFLMLGDGRASDIWSNQAVSVIDITGSVGSTFQYPRLHNLAVRNTNVAGTCIRTRYTEFLEIASCVIADGLNGIMMSESGGEFDIKPQIHQCIFVGSINGLKGGDTRIADAVIRDNMFIDCTTAMLDFGYLDGGVVSGNKLFSNNAGSNSVIGIRLKKPIYVSLTENAFFELGGSGLVLMTPRYSQFNNNKFVNVGQNTSGAALTITDFDASIVGVDTQIVGNTFKDTNGSAIVINSINALQSRFTIRDNYFESVGDTGIGDAVSLTKVTDSLIADNYIDGKTKTRYWLSVDAATNIRLRGNKYTGCVNTDVNRVNSPSMVFDQSTSNNLAVTATTTLTYNDDTVLCDATGGAITINLPVASSCPGKIYRIGKKDASANAVVIDPVSTQTVDGAATLSITTQWQVVTIMADGSGTNWITVSV